jgi:hypothetical protein
MTVSLVMLAGGAAANPVAAIESALTLIDSYQVVDTGIPADTRQAIEGALADLPGDLVDDPWDGSGPGFTRALQRAQGTADWLLHLHADEVAEIHPDMREWLQADESPDTDAWMLEIVNPHLTHRLPRLLRGNQEWIYQGCAHEYLEIAGRQTRWLNGLTLHHHGWSDPAKFEWALEALKPAYEAKEPRAVFYTGESLRDLGRTEEAISVYRERAAMNNGWDEERWYASYQAAALAGDVEELLYVYRLRPWRAEPLAFAARIIAHQGHGDDTLFIEEVA